jgi:hypothetical protein
MELGDSLKPYWYNFLLNNGPLATCVGFTTPTTFPFTLCENIIVLGISAFYLGPSSDVNLGDDHMIACATISSLNSN